MSYTPQWLKLVQQFDKENLRDLPEMSTRVHDNGISQVWTLGEDDGDYIVKRSIPYLIENEMFFLKLLSHTGYVPKVERYDKYSIKMPDYGTSDVVAEPEELKFHFEQFLFHLDRAAVIHGDLTKPNIIIKDDYPWFLDWGEARLEKELRPAKRLGGDARWLWKTYEELTNG